MKYVVLLYADERRWPTLTEAERDETVRAHLAFDAAVSRRATSLGGEALADTDEATTLRRDADRRPVVSDGPFAETVEQLGGFYLLEADDLDVVTSVCEELPHWYTVEIRPVVDMSPTFAEVEAAAEAGTG